MLHADLSWTHYRTLLRVDKAEARAFYEIEAIDNNWLARELERQINSLLYERLALSKDKRGLMRLARKGQEIRRPADVFKDPVVIEFLGLPESPRLVESELEAALLDNLQAFLLELGKGFAFVARQQRITLDGDHFYIDLGLLSHDPQVFRADRPQDGQVDASGLGATSTVRELLRSGASHGRGQPDAGPYPLYRQERRGGKIHPGTGAIAKNICQPVQVVSAQ